MEFEGSSARRCSNIPGFRGGIFAELQVSFSLPFWAFGLAVYTLSFYIGRGSQVVRPRSAKSMKPFCPEYSGVVSGHHFMETQRVV